MSRLFFRAVQSFGGTKPLNHHAETRLLNAERRGLQLAILCRTVGFGLATAYYVFSLLLSGDAPTLRGVALLAALTALGVAHFIVIGTRWDRPWLKFLTVAVDVLAICTVVAAIDLSRGSAVPQIYVFQIFGIYVLMPFIALAALSLSPSLVMWAGFLSVVGWWGAFIYIMLGMEMTLSWSDLPNNATRAEYEALVFSEFFVARGTRMVESISVIIVAAVLAIAVARAKHMFVSQVKAEEDREAERQARARITNQLGRFVPAAIARRLIEDPSGLSPQVRHGAVLVMDIQDFTAYAARRGPADVIADLNAFLAKCADYVSAGEGVVISFTGDGLLATFNTPLEVAEPEHMALEAARALTRCGREFGFVVRVGIAAGPIAAGSVGSNQRQAFTVYGDTVNRASRLEALAKDLGDQILVDNAIMEADPQHMDERGDHTLRGFRDPVSIWSAAPQEGQSSNPPENALAR
ncbi:MAG: adenylate/guanylate cyclase domain-containing protein [Pseudomonadota bacterium]